MAASKTKKPPKDRKPLAVGNLFRENKGWVFVSVGKVTEEQTQRIKDYWATVSDLPIVVFAQTNLLLKDDGSIEVREVTFVE
jgi:hypothetical protein